jgi:hypothetical protein
MPHLFRRISITVPFLFLTILLSACTASWRTDLETGDAETLEASFWQTQSVGSHYPEMVLSRDLRNRKSFAVAFQGGGNRAAPAALGQLRALHDLDWIKKVRYISSVSGGSWTAIPYTFLKRCASKEAASCDEEQFLEERFLGVSHSPQDVARQLPKLVAKTTSEDFEHGSMLRAMADSTITAKMIKAWAQLKFDEAFAAAIGEIYLEPFGLGKSENGVPDSLFTWRKGDRKRILARNPHLANTPIHFVERDRPYLIAGSTILTKRTLIKPKNKFRVEMTPLYTGVPQSIEYQTRKGGQIQLGGGFVESFVYDLVTDIAPKAGTSNTITLRDAKRGRFTNASRLNFSLSNVAGATGAAPVEAGVSIRGLRFLVSNFGFPEHYAPSNQATPPEPISTANNDGIKEKEWSHGDGGHEDNLGLASLLARQVDNILVFANSTVPLDIGKFEKCKLGVDNAPAIQPDPEKLSKEMKECIDMIGDDLPSFFVNTKKHIHNVGLRLVDRDAPQGRENLAGYYDLLAVAKDLKKNENLSCKRYQYTPVTRANGHGPIQSAPYSPMICILFLGLDAGWVNDIKKTTKRENMSKSDIKAIRKTLDLDQDWMSDSKKKFGFGSKGFPHISTFGDKAGYLIKVSKPRLFALSNFTSWKLKKHHDKISEAFNSNGLVLPLLP